jgi:hypothetical protein
MFPDLRFAFRQLMKAPGFTFLAVHSRSGWDWSEHRNFQRHQCGPSPAFAISNPNRVVIVTETEAEQPSISVSFSRLSRLEEGKSQFRGTRGHSEREL